MSRASVYNRNYPGMKFEKGTMLAHDLRAKTIEYMYKALFLNFESPLKEAHRIAVTILLTQCLDHANRVSKGVDVTTIKNHVNNFMSINEFAPAEILSLVCSYMEYVLFQSDSYHGFNNYKWSNGGSNLWHNDHLNKYDSPEQHTKAMEAMRNYMSQEYHRVYY